MNHVTRLFFLFLVLLLPAIADAQIAGCTDPQANNYNPSANVNDGSCTYNLTLYSPKLKYILPEEVEETSGLTFFNGGLWTLNDSGGEPVIYKLDTLTGQIIQRIRIKNGTNVDWEDLTLDQHYVYIGDFGNNRGNRKDLKVYRVARNDIPASGDTEVTADIIAFYYPDQPDKPITKRKYNNYDCEAMLSAGDSLYLFSKDWEDNRTRLYALPKEPGNYAARLTGSFNSAGLVTAADYNPQTREVVLIGYTNHSWVPFAWLLFDFNNHDFFSGNKRRIDMPNIMTTQTEGFTFVQGKYGFISSEKTRLGKQSVYDFYTGKWTGETASVVILKGNGHRFDFTIAPNPVKNNKIKLYLQNIPDGEYQILLYDGGGKLLQLKKYRLKRNKQQLYIQLKTFSLPSGTYSVRITNGNRTVTKKFVKQ